ncbi:MAG: helix-turn-helix transcriptional regulator [Clostridia bacterium]|nr:helix-turn-helix transcriptional regulator [Clostridia bacterium]
MILADKIMMLRKKNGWSQEELAEKLNVSRQSVSKWEGGLSVPDMNKIIGMSALFGVSTDYLLKDELESITPSETAERDDKGAVRSVSLEEANRYLDTVERLSRRIVLAVMLCILSPACLIFLGGCADEVAGFLISENFAIGIGMITLFLLVGVAVAIFIPTGMQLSEFSYLDKEEFSLDYGVKGIVEKRLLSYIPRYRMLLTLGIMLCIFSAVPLIVFAIMEASLLLLVGSTALVLVICSIGVALIVRACYINGSCQRLLQTGEFTEENKKRTRENEALDSAYWGVFTALYLGVSFLTMKWHITWIIWLVAGCLSPVFQYVIGLLRKK